MAKLINKTTGKEVNEGDQVISFRDEHYIIEGMTPPHKPSSEGKVYAKPVDGGMRRELYPSVFDLKFVDHQFDKPLKTKKIGDKIYLSFIQ